MEPGNEQRRSCSQRCDKARDAELLTASATDARWLLRSGEQRGRPERKRESGKVGGQREAGGLRV
ncbi:hypothetical protein SESBI_23058 [Sesbania bispinosa]|nr:hypothetical protein SESBI_23058 [Sesbania bispinosa]